MGHFSKCLIQGVPIRLAPEHMHSLSSGPPRPTLVPPSLINSSVYPRAQGLRAITIICMSTYAISRHSHADRGQLCLCLLKWSRQDMSREGDQGTCFREMQKTALHCSVADTPRRGRNRGCHHSPGWQGKSLILGT